MHNRNEHSSRKSHSETQTTGTEPVETMAASIVTAQFEVVRAMNQYALMWFSLPMAALTATSTPIEEKRSSKNSSNVKDRSDEIARDPAPVILWPVGTMISGVEDTLHDQFFEPRPDEAPEQDVMTLWARSNEFEETSRPASLAETDDQRAA